MAMHYMHYKKLVFEVWRIKCVRKYKDKTYLWSQYQPTALMSMGARPETVPYNNIFFPHFIQLSTSQSRCPCSNHSLCQLICQMRPSPPVTSLFQLCVATICCLCSCVSQEQWGKGIGEEECATGCNQLVSWTWPWMVFLLGNLWKIFSERLFSVRELHHILWNNFFFFKKNWAISKTRRLPSSLNGSWWRTGTSLSFSTTKGCCLRVRCHVFDLFASQQLSTTDGRTCLLSTDPGDPGCYKCYLPVFRFFILTNLIIWMLLWEREVTIFSVCTVTW